MSPSKNNLKNALKNALVGLSIQFAERGWLPDSWLRWGIRRFCQQRLDSLEADPEKGAEATEAFLQAMKQAPIAAVPDLANQQHYEVPASFFQLMLGPRLKYSCCYWSSPQSSLAEAEREALQQTCDHALLQDGQKILELGCGWGSLTLYIAQRYPGSSITAVSNSASQKSWILARAQELGLTNLEIKTADINDYQAEERFDRIVSVEMFEHVRNHDQLLKRLRTWLTPDGYLMVHIFCGGGPPYAYEDQGPEDWMSRNFFSGGIMPSDDLLLRYSEHFSLERQWRWSGLQYQRTLESWLQRLDAQRAEALKLLRESGQNHPVRALQRWRIFLLACSELFGYQRGRCWWVSHYRMRPRA